MLYGCQLKSILHLIITRLLNGEILDQGRPVTDSLINHNSSHVLGKVIKLKGKNWALFLNSQWIYKTSQSAQQRQKIISLETMEWKGVKQLMRATWPQNDSCQILSASCCNHHPYNVFTGKSCQITHHPSFLNVGHEDALLMFRNKN